MTALEYLETKLPKRNRKVNFGELSPSIIERAMIGFARHQVSLALDAAASCVEELDKIEEIKSSYLINRIL